MATATKRPRTLFGEILRRELESQEVSTRELARRLTAGDPDRIENARRTLIRYIRGQVTPGEQAREAIAEALSIDASVFAEGTERREQHDRVRDALDYLADVLLDIAVQAREGQK